MQAAKKILVPHHGKLRMSKQTGPSPLKLHTAAIRPFTHNTGRSLQCQRHTLHQNHPDLAFHGLSAKASSPTMSGVVHPTIRGLPAILPTQLSFARHKYLSHDSIDLCEHWLTWAPSRWLVPRDLQHVARPGHDAESQGGSTP